MNDKILIVATTLGKFGWLMPIRPLLILSPLGRDLVHICTRQCSTVTGGHLLFPDVIGLLLLHTIRGVVALPSIVLVHVDL